jgi:hypothetical protein
MAPSDTGRNYSPNCEFGFRLGTRDRPMSRIYSAFVFGWLTFGLALSVAWAGFLSYELFKLAKLAL